MINKRYTYTYRTNKSQSNMFKYLKKKNIVFERNYNCNLLYESLFCVVQVHDLTNVNMRRILHLRLLLEDRLLLLDCKKNERKVYFKIQSKKSFIQKEFYFLSNTYKTNWIFSVSHLINERQQNSHRHR
jgi:hypothetical protein